MSKEKDTQQILFQEDFHANHLALQEKENQQQMIVTSGMKCLESLEKSNQDGLLAKMLKALLISTKAWYSDRCLMTWKTKVSKANVLLFQLQASVLGIKENESGLLQTTYPTPTRGMYKQDVKDNGEYARRIKEKGHQIMLPAFVKLYPTPVVSDHLHNQSESIENWKKRAAEKKKQGINLHFALRHHVQMYPTPTASDMEGGAAKDVQIENGHFFRQNKKGVRWGVKLRDAIEMYPTPRASATMTEDMETIAKRNKYNSKLEEKIAIEMYHTPTTNDAKNLTFPESQRNRSSIIGDMMKDNKPGGKLNPNFVEFLMGYPMNWTKIDPTE